MDQPSIERVHKLLAVALDRGAAENEAYQAFRRARTMVLDDGMDMEELMSAMLLVINPPPPIPINEIDWDDFFKLFDEPPEDYTESYYQETIYINREIPFGKYQGYPIRLVAYWDPDYIAHMCDTMTLQGWLGKTLRVARVRFCDSRTTEEVRQKHKEAQHA